MAEPEDDPIGERATIKILAEQLNAVVDASDADVGLRAIAALITAARCARRADMPPLVAAAMVADYINRGNPV